LEIGQFLTIFYFLIIIVFFKIIIIIEKYMYMLFLLNKSIYAEEKIKKKLLINVKKII